MYHPSQVIHMLVPGDRVASIRARLAAAALIVEEEIMAFGEAQHLGQQIPVVGPWPTMQYERARRPWWSICHPVQRHRSRGRVQVAWSRDRKWH